MMNKYKTFIFKKSEESKLNTNIIIDSINDFWENVIQPLNTNKEISLIYRVVYYQNKKRFTLLRSKSFTQDELHLFQGLILSLFEYNVDDSLKNNVVNKIVIKYKVLEERTKVKSLNNFKLGNYRIPMTMNLNLWGIIFNFDSKTVFIKKKSTNSLIKVDQINEFKNNIEIKNDQNKNLIAFTDIRRSNDPLNTFVRIFQHHIYYIYNGTRVFKLNKSIKI